MDESMMQVPYKQAVRRHRATQRKKSSKSSRATARGSPATSADLYREKCEKCVARYGNVSLIKRRIIDSVFHGKIGQVLRGATRFHEEETLAREIRDVESMKTSRASVLKRSFSLWLASDPRISASTLNSAFLDALNDALLRSIDCHHENQRRDTRETTIWWIL